MDRLGFWPGFTHMEYLDTNNALHQIEEVLSWDQARRDGMGAQAREFIIDNHTYRHRAASALEVLGESGIIDEQPPKKE